MGFPHRLALTFAIGLLFVASAPAPAFAAFRLWTGAGPNNLWTTPQNWQGNVAPAADDTLSFPTGALQTTNVNNFPAGTRFRTLNFDATYIVSGNRIQIDTITVHAAAGGTAVLQCDITFGGTALNAFIGVDPGTFLVTTGAISGTLLIQKAGLGTWNIGGASPNTYSGLTQVNIGPIVLNKPAGVAAIPAGLRIGSSSGAADTVIVRLASDRQIVGPVEIRASGLLDLNGHVDSIGALTLRSGHITTGAGELTLEADVDVFDEGSTIEGRLALGGPTRVFTTHSTLTQNALTIFAAIGATGGDGGVIKRGPGLMRLGGANAYGGVTRLEAGTLWLIHSLALGIAAADAGTIVLPDGQIILSADIQFEPLLLQKNNATEPALTCQGGLPRRWRGPIHLTGSNGFFGPSGCDLALGRVSGPGELWIAGFVTLLESGNNYAGDTRIRGDLGGRLTTSAANQIPDSSIVRLESDGVLNLNGFNDTVASIAGPAASRVRLGAGTLTVASPAQIVESYAGVISETGNVVHNGPGRWVLTGLNQHTGSTSVMNGTLQINGALAAASLVAVNGTGLLTGVGNVGAMVGINGRFRPGRDDGLGTFSTDGVVFSAGLTFDVVLRPHSGTRLDVDGTVNLGNAALALRKIDGVQIDTPIVLIDNDGADAINGTFAGLPEGSIVTAGDQQFRLSYVGGTGNDVVVAPTELTYFLSEGSTGAFFDTEIAIANPHQAIVPVTVEFLVEGGGQVIAREYELAPMSRVNILVDEIAGLESAAVSTKVRSTNAVPIVVERTMWWGGAARYGAHTEKASGGVARKWYFAEGAQGFFFTFLLLANPTPQPNDAAVRFLLEGGGEVVKTYSLPPLSRQTVSAGDVPELVGRAFGTEVTFTHGGVAERAMYFGTNPFWTAGHESAGVPAPSTRWFLAEGATGPFFETFILLANPNAEAANTLVRFLPASGPAVVKPVDVPGNGRVTINIETQDESLANVPVATDVASSLPIVVERAQYWPDPAPQWYEAHNSFGVTETWPKWGLAEGRVGGLSGYQTYILLANPSANTATVNITFLRESGAPIVKQFTVNPASRLNVSIGSGADVPELTNERFGALIESNVDIAVERALYANSGSQLWGAGTNATATRLP